MTKSLTILNSEFIYIYLVNVGGRAKTSEEKLGATEVVLLGLIKESISLS